MGSTCHPSTSNRTQPNQPNPTNQPSSRDFNFAVKLASSSSSLPPLRSVKSSWLQHLPSFIRKMPFFQRLDPISEVSSILKPVYSQPFTAFHPKKQPLRLFQLAVRTFGVFEDLFMRLFLSYYFHQVDQSLSFQGPRYALPNCLWLIVSKASKGCHSPMNCNATNISKSQKSCMILQKVPSCTLQTRGKPSTAWDRNTTLVIPPSCKADMNGWMAPHCLLDPTLYQLVSHLPLTVTSQTSRVQAFAEKQLTSSEVNMAALSLLASNSFSSLVILQNS